MIRKSTLALGFRALLILASLQAPAQNQRIAQQVASPSSVIPAYLKFEDGSGPSQVEFPRYLESNYKLPAGFSWKLIKEEKDNAGFSHQRFIQTYQGKELKGTMLISHSKNGIVSSFNGESTSEIPATSSASLVAADARVSALKYINAKTYKWQMPEEEAHLKKEQNDPKATFFPQGELVFYKPSKGSFQLAYRFDIYAHEPVSRQYVYVDANSGKVLGEEELILHTDEIGSAVTGYSGTQQITADNTGAGFRLRESGRGLGIETYNLQKGTSYAAAVDFTDTDNVWNNVNANEDQYATDAHFGAEKTYDYFMSRYNRNSIDGNGFKLISYVHYSTNYVNAYWDGSRMTYGDGDATYNPLTSMDIAGHEITHGLTNFSANLVYSYESGALNESFSDIFGTAIEFYSTPGIADWLIGEDIGGAFRSMSNPNVYGQPDTYLGTSWYAGAGDNGGVHYNSGVQNFWFYLLSVGGSGTNDIGNAYNVSAIGIDKAAAIAFRTLTTYLTPNSQYADARFYSIQAATDLYGACSPEVIATTAAWYAVGVGSNTVSANPIITYAGSTTLCSGNTITLNASNLPNYQWNLNGQPISGATAQSYTTGASGSYTVSTLACNNTYTSAPVSVNITTAEVSVQATSTNSCEPINITATATPGYVLQWMKNGIDISGANQSNYEASTSGSYAARINSTIGPAVTLNSTGTSSIPDNSCPGATNIIVASGLPTAMNPAGLSVSINITHTWNADLKIWLEAPNGDLLGLANAVGGSADNFTNTVFSDAGTAQIPASGAPYTGTYKPWQSAFTICSATMNRTSFAAFGNGTINPNGSWKLRVADAAGADVGTINNWSISFPQTITPSPDCGPVTSTPINIEISTPTSYYVDADLDGFGSESTQLICSSNAPAGFSTTSGDCNDNNSLINPNATEICGNGIDDNCNGQTDELCVSYTYYADVDGDGSGNYSSSISTYSNVAPSGYVTVFGDCNDNDSSIQSPITYYVDLDNDGIGSYFTASFCSSTAPAGFSTNTGDCDDVDASIQTSVTYYVDADGDGFGSSTTSIWCSAVAPSGFSSQSGDCNDNSSLINPNATEICGNGIDDNCNGLVDENTAALGVVAAINGPSGVCKNQQGVTFSVDAVSNATNYAWTVPAGATIASGQGSATITVNFSSTQTAGNICVTASNACLSNAAVCRSLIIYTAKPATPGVISGSNIEACANTTRTFSISPVTNATNYTWTAPTNATVISGQGTTSATISFGTTFTSGTLSVKASNCIGVSSNKSMTIYSKPSTPSSITGTLNGVCGGTSTNYTCPLVNGATSYNWTVPAGWVINSGQGTNSINLTTPAVYTSGSVSVAASSACGTSTNRTVTVRSVPAVPGTVTGTASNLCGGGTFTYSIAAVTGATGYVWTAPANCTITSNTGTSISLSVPANFTTGTLSVRAENACGQSAPKNVSLTRLPSTPVSVTGTATVCSGSQGISYSTAAIAGLTYTWTVPAGATIASGQGTNSITVNWGTTQGNVSVKANNACGSSSTRTFAVTLTACREMAEMTEETAVAPLSIELYPNPGQGEFNLKFNGLNETANVRIYTVTGQIVQQFQVAANSQLAAFYLNDQADGIYFLRIETATEIKEIKVVKH
jgi:Zn-dependent metalloprotease/subtilisin-like proprotein convertase family protein